MNKKTQRIYVFVKRQFDIVISVIMLCIFLPLGVFCGIVVKILEPKDPVFFVQERVGLHGKVFNMLKFRTMKTIAPSNCSTKEFKDSGNYITTFGKVLRYWSIDELPQLCNVLKGDMSLIGPRPLILSEEDVHKKRFQNGVYEVRPGITGLAQINGRDLLDDEEKVRYDTLYVKNMGMKQDLKIMIKTITTVFKHMGIKG